MILDPLIDQITSILCWLLPVALATTIIKSPWFKGVIGEVLVKLSGRILLPTHVYHRIHNVTLQMPDGTTQIDHILVSRFGIFVVETKNMRGWIFGGKHQAQWTQRIYKNTFKFQNPLRQNYKHIKALEALLEVPPDTIHSVVVFAGNSTFKTPMPANVTQAGGYIRYIKSFRTPVLSEAEVENVVEQILSDRLEPTRETHRQHVQQLQERRGSGARRSCPECGSPMVKRKAKRGAHIGKRFLGCSMYPECRVIQQFD